MPGILIQWMLIILLLNDNSNENSVTFLTISYQHDKESVVVEKIMNKWVFVIKYIFISIPGMLFFYFPLNIASTTLSIDFKFHR